MAYRLITPPDKQKTDKLAAGQNKTVKNHPLRLFFLLTALLVMAVLLLSSLRPLPAISPVKSPLEISATSPIQLPWPAYGQSAIGAQGYGLLQTNGQQTPVPMASVAKVVTALAVLQKKPIVAGQKGPILTMSANDVALHEQYFSEGGSNVAVQEGEQLSEYQALQALLLPSANNMADSLANWAFGTVENYTVFANQWLKTENLGSTTMSDASGFSDKTVSSAADLVKLGEIAMNNPVLAEIVSQAQANLPVAGTVNNTNWLLNEDGVVGIKTGNTEQAKGCYLFAAKRTVQNRVVTLIGATMGAPDLNQAISDSRQLIRSADSGFKEATIVKKGQVLGQYNSSWGSSAQAIAQKDVDMLVWQGSKPSAKIILNDINTPAFKDSTVGAVKASLGNQQAASPLILNTPIEKPPLLWRAVH